MKQLKLSTIGVRSLLPPQQECITLVEQGSTLWSFWTLLNTDRSSKARCAYVLKHAHAHVGRGILLFS